MGSGSRADDETPERDAAVADPRPQVAVGPTVNRDTWTVNWAGVAVVGLIAVVALIAWRSVGDDGSSEIGASVESMATTPTVPARATSTTVPATTSTAPAATTTAPATTEPERRVEIVGEVKPCRFGDACLAASFTIVGFADQPGRFVCIYPNSSRDFTFDGDGKLDACLTADEGDTIAIEVDGVRSVTISADDLDGTTGAP